MTFESNLKKLEEFIIVLVMILSGYIVTAFFKINNYFTFPNLDEMLWHLRSSVFWEKLPNFDFSGLIQSAQPGITVYWFTGFMMKFIDFDFTDVTRRIFEKEAEGLDFNSVVNNSDPVTYKVYETISFAFNFPLFLLTVAFFISFYYLLRKLGFNKIISYFALLFLTTNTFLIYWTTPSDKMLNIFMTLSFMTILVYFNESKKRKYLYLSAVLGALAVLSKLSALFLLPFFFFLFIYYSWPLNKKKIKLIIKDYFFWILIFIIISIIFLPTIITNPEEVWNLVFKSKNVIQESNKIGEYSQRVVFEYLKTLLFMFTGNTVQLPAMSLIAYFLIKRKKKSKNIFNCLPQKNIQAIGLYVILFFLMVTVASSNHDIRFMSPVFLILNIFSAIGFYGLLEIISQKIGFSAYNKKVFYVLAFLLVVLSQFFYTISTGLLMSDILNL